MVRTPILSLGRALGRGVVPRSTPASPSGRGATRSSVPPGSDCCDARGAIAWVSVAWDATTQCQRVHGHGLVCVNRAVAMAEEPTTLSDLDLFIRHPRPWPGGVGTHDLVDKGFPHSTVGPASPTPARSPGPVRNGGWDPRRLFHRDRRDPADGVCPQGPRRTDRQAWLWLVLVTGVLGSDRRTVGGPPVAGNRGLWDGGPPHRPLGRGLDPASSRPASAQAYRPHRYGEVFRAIRRALGQRGTPSGTGSCISSNGPGEGISWLLSSCRAMHRRRQHRAGDCGEVGSDAPSDGARRVGC